MFLCTGMGCFFDVRMSVDVGRCQVERRWGSLLVASKGDNCTSVLTIQGTLMTVHLC